MNKQPNIVFLMTDQHNAASMGCAGHPNVKTPTMDWIAENGVRFTSAYCNNPICSPSRLSFVSGQYPHTHRILSNNNFEMDDCNPHTLGAVLRGHGYQTANIGKSHMIKKWDEAAYEHIRYCDLCDADRGDPRSNHYFKYLLDNGLADMYEDGTLPEDHEHNRAWSAVAKLPYEHSNEHWTGNETIAFLENRDPEKPFFLHMSFERPHPNWMPSAEHADMYDPKEIQLGPDAVDWWENKWAGRPDFIIEQMTWVMSHFKNKDILKKALAYHFALVTVIDMEMGRVIDHLKKTGELENTIIVYSADHGDFAGDHGVCNKNVGIYESIHKIPFLLKYPAGPKGVTRDGIIESVDLFPTLCELAGVDAPEGVDGRSIIPEAEGKGKGKEFALCEWDFPAPQRYVSAVRTPRHRLVYYPETQTGELYDHQTDPYEMHNLWDQPEYQDIKIELQGLLFDRGKPYSCKSDFDNDIKKAGEEGQALTRLLHKSGKKWSEIVNRG